MRSHVVDYVGRDAKCIVVCIAVLMS